MNVDRLAPPVTTLVVGGAMAYAMSDACLGLPRFYLVVGGVYLVGALVAVARMYRDGTLIDLFKWRSGDLAMGAASALFVGLAMHGGRALVAPRGTVRDLWIVRLYGQPPEPPPGGQNLLLYIGALAVIGALSIITWQGLVQQSLEEWIGVRRGFIVTAVLFAIAHAPSVQLTMPGAGPNPLLLFATLLSGLVWGFMAGRLQRLSPSMVSAAGLAIAIMTQFRLFP